MLTTWSFEKAGDSTGGHVHEYDYVLVPVTDGRVDRPCRRLTARHARSPQIAGSPSPRSGRRRPPVTADADGIVFIEVELKK